MLQIPGVLVNVPVAEVFDRDLKGDGLGLTGTEGDALESLQLLGRPVNLGIDTVDIQLSNFVSLHVAIVGQGEGDLDRLLGSGGVHGTVGEIDIGQTVTESVHRLDVLGVEPAVTHEEALGVLGGRLRHGVEQALTLFAAQLGSILTIHEGEEVTTLGSVGEVAERKGRGVFELGREGERKLAGRGDVTEENLGEGVAASHTVPPALDNGRGVLLEDTEVARTTGNQDGNEVRIDLVEGLDDFFLTGRQVDVGTVAAFGLDALVGAAEEDDDISTLGCFNSLSEEVRIGRLIDCSGLQRVRGTGRTPAAAAKVLVTRGIDYLGRITGTLGDTLERSDFEESLDTGTHTTGLGLQDGVLADNGDPSSAGGPCLRS